MPMEGAGFGGLLALGWLVLAAYIVLLLVVSAVFAVKHAAQAAYRQFAAWYRRPQVREVRE